MTLLNYNNIGCTLHELGRNFFDMIQRNEALEYLIKLLQIKENVRANFETINEGS